MKNLLTFLLFKSNKLYYPNNGYCYILNGSMHFHHLFDLIWKLNGYFYIYILPICNFWKSHDRIKQSILYFVGNRTFHYYRSSLRCAHSSIQLSGSSIINFFFHFSQPIKTFEICFLFRFYFSFSSDIYLEKSLQNLSIKECIQVRKRSPSDWLVCFNVYHFFKFNFFPKLSFQFFATFFSQIRFIWKLFIQFESNLSLWHHKINQISQ